MRARTNFFLSFRSRPAKHTFWAGCILFLSLNSPLSAQTVRPLIDENVVKGPGKNAKGKIEYINDSLQALNVVLDLRSFTVSDTGELSYRQLDDGIHAKFSTMNFRIPPKQNFFVFYEASSDKLPSWFVVYATFAGFKERTQDGLRIQIQLPHTVYLLPKRQLQKDDVVVRVAEYYPEEKKVVVRVENTGPSFGRVLETDVTSARDKSTQGGFPIFPFTQRQVEIPWDASGGPATVRLRLAHFKLEQGVAKATH